MVRSILTAFAFVLGCVAMSSPGALTGADDKKDKKGDKSGIDKAKLVGVWSLSEEGILGAKGTTYEFTKDGKLKVAVPKKKGTADGTYKLDGATLTWKYGLAGVQTESPPLKVTKVTDKDLTLEGVDGKAIAFTKK